MVATSFMWLQSTSNVPGMTEELNFSFDLILIKLRFNDDRTVEAQEAHRNTFKLKGTFRSDSSLV